MKPASVVQACFSHYTYVFSDTRLRRTEIRASSSNSEALDKTFERTKCKCMCNESEGVRILETAAFTEPSKAITLHCEGDSKCTSSTLLYCF